MTISEEKVNGCGKYEIDAIFNLFDRDRNGVIDIEDLKITLHSTRHYATYDELNDIIKDISKNGKDFIEYDDFEKFAENQLEDCRDDLVRDAFQVFDCDQDGYINKNDLRKLITNFLSSPTEEELNDLLEEADRNGDGQIDFEDFVNAIKAQ
ncbi:neo-calmodulin-like [Clavelina lepadiformis]|uniref:neo-calmodulin-like n=1 Tax=Clavelina lepadiformis TaxID=159417 RepID=UPI0040432E21